MNKPSLFLQKNWHWAIATTAILAVIIATSCSFANNAEAAPPQINSRTVTVWIQTIDSCAQALSGATFTASGSNFNATTKPTAGNEPKILPSYKETPKAQRHCPENQGTCTNDFSTGCTYVVLNVPTVGTAQYTITVNKLPPGHGSNVSFAPCEGGPACHNDAADHPIKETAYVTVNANSNVQAWVQNTEPDGTQDRWPATGFFAATQANPIPFHFFGVSATAHGKFTCDNDGDADDYMTGTSKWSHCDNDDDKH
jgi:hypothetical protein